jgi:hypothetical protein
MSLRLVLLSFVNETSLSSVSRVLDRLLYLKISRRFKEEIKIYKNAKYYRTFYDFLDNAF